MKTSNLRTALAFLLGLSAIAASAQSSFYGGDFDQRDAIASERGTSVSDSRVYDDFSLATASSVTSLYGNFLLDADAAITGLHYEVRQGISSGNGGTLVASGDVAATLADTGTQGLGLELYTITSAPVGFDLGAGSYFLSLAATSTTGTGNAYLATTDGTNGIGGPLGDGDSFIDSPDLGFSYSTSEDAFGATYDFSQGLVAAPVPEPGTMAALGLGALLVLRRRPRR